MVGGAVVVVVGVVLGVLTARDPALGIVVAAGIVILGIAIADLSLVVVAAVPATLVLLRVGGLLSISDLVLAGSTVGAFLLLRGRDVRGLQPLLWAGTVYLAAAIPVQILHPYSDNVLEWLHELVLVVGSMVVGFAIGREGRARRALSAYLIACSGIGGWAAVVAGLAFVRTGAFEAVYLPGLHKNTIGGMLAVAVVIAFARPVWAGWTRGWAYTALALCGLGVLAAQSRQGLVGAIVGMLFIAIRPRPQTGRHSRWVWLAVIPVGAYVLSEVNAQLASDNRFNSAHQRLTWYDDALQVWQESPIFGVGLRWWYTDRFEARFQPPNAELEVLTSVGVVGLIAFLVMFAVALRFLIRMDPVYGTVGAAVVLTRFAQAQFDLYWVAGQASLLWIVAGICCGVQARDRAAAEAAMDPRHGPTLRHRPTVRT